jgi:beta-xylosidase
VVAHKKPDVARQPQQVPIVNDEFIRGFHLGWQWSANPMLDWADTTINNKLRLKSISSPENLWEAGNLLTQKLPGMNFTASTQITLEPKRIGERAGLLVLGYNYGWIGLENTADGIRLVQVTRENANLYTTETKLTAPVAVNGPVTVKIRIQPVIVAQPEPDYPVVYPSLLRAYHAKVTFSYSLDGKKFSSIGPGFIAPPGRWVGAQIGLFAQAASGTPAFVATSTGHADFEYFSVSANGDR